MLAVGGLVLAARSALLLAGRGRPKRGPTPRFIIAGPYRRMRNPLYAGVLLAFGGLTLATGWTDLAMITAALEGKLDRVETIADPIFGVQVPKEVPGVPTEVLTPKNTWADKAAFDEKAKYLAGLFVKNFEKYASGVSEEILAAAPKI